MRDEQFTKLEALQERLVDVVLFEAEPENWTAHGKLPKEMTQEERGDRYWCKRNVSATVTLLNKTLSLAFFRDRQPSRPPEDAESANDDLNQEILEAEKNANKILKMFEQRQRQKAGQ